MSVSGSTVWCRYYTLGCKVNRYETEALRRILSGKGITCCDGESVCGIDSNSDVSLLCIINSCTVTAQADKKCRQLIHRLRRETPDCKILLMGCLPQASPDAAAEYFESGLCDSVLGNTSIADAADAAVSLALYGRRTFKLKEHPFKAGIERFDDCAIELCGQSAYDFGGKTRAYIKIQDGCNQFCSYCIIPYARGRSRSRSLDSIQNEAARLSESGHREVVLTGINLCRYGDDLEGRPRLSDAVKAAAAADGVERVRLGSIEPELLTDFEIERLAATDKLCPHFHLSLQSGCDRTLKAMNRKYLTADYYKLVQNLRASFQDCSVTTDIMVGFPQETQEDFMQSLDFVRKTGFAKAHIFTYSPRPHTPAAAMTGQVPEEEKRRRAKLMKEVCDSSEYEFLQKMIGKRVKVLFEKENCTSFHNGYSPNYTQIKIARKNPQKSLRRESFYVIIKSAEKDGYCIGELCKEQLLSE